MENYTLHFYRIDMKYIRCLHQIDDRVLSVSPQTNKENRPFLGIIVVCNKCKYCIPLSSPKQKHQQIRDKIDFKKILMGDTIIGVLNFNLMIPVESAQIKRIDMKIRKHDTPDVKRKKKRLQQELEWCRAHERDLRNTANVLYQAYISGEPFSARNRCLDFPRMEQACSKYNEKIRENRNL